MKTPHIPMTTHAAIACRSQVLRQSACWRVFAAAAIAMLSVFAPLAGRAQEAVNTSRVIAVQRSGYFGVVPGQTLRVNIVFCDGSVLPNPNLVPFDVFAQVAFIDETGKVVKTSERTKVTQGTLISADCPVEGRVVGVAAAAPVLTKMPLRAEVQLSVDAPQAAARFRFPRPLTIDLGSAQSTLEIFDSNTQGILIGLLLPAVQRVREAASIVIMPQ